MRTLLSVSLSAAVLVCGGAAFAAPAPDQMRSEVVSLGDLNLASATGANTALVRLHGAANRVCANGASSRQLAAWADYQSCRHQAMDDGVTRLNAPLVTARYVKKTPAPSEVLASR